MSRPLTWVTVSRSALRFNLRQFQRLVAPANVMPVIKGNAYGHGGREIASLLPMNSVWGVGVASLSEALQLKQVGIKGTIVVLNYCNQPLTTAVRHGIQLPVYDLAFAKKLNGQAKRLGKKALVHLKYDSGTTRLGLTDKGFIILVKQLSRLAHLEVVGIFSHLAESENPTSDYTDQQLQRFSELVRKSNNFLPRKLLTHIACTAASLNFPSSRQSVIRLGIGLYGLWPSGETKRTFLRHHKAFQLKPVLSWFTRVIQVKTVPPKTPIGYNRTFTTKRLSRIAVLPVGYGEGYDRGLSNGGVVLIDGQRCPVRGRVGMNLTMVDVTGVAKVKTGSVATLIGKEGRGVVTADELADYTETINYEVVTRINPLLPRVIIP